MELMWLAMSIPVFKLALVFRKKRKKLIIVMKEGNK